MDCFWCLLSRSQFSCIHCHLLACQTEYSELVTIRESILRLIEDAHSFFYSDGVEYVVWRLRFYRMRSTPFLARVVVYGLSILVIMLLGITDGLRLLATRTGAVQARPGVVSQAFEQAEREFQVPAALLKAICYMEGRLSNNDGHPSMDNGYGCMHLIQNTHGDLLDRAAQDLKVSVDQLKLNMPTNIRGGAALLRSEALQLSATHRLPGELSEWYGAVAAYSHASTRATALMYAEAVYTLLEQGFNAEADDGEIVTLTPQRIHPNVVSAAVVESASTALPAGCTRDHNVDYPQAIDCMVPAQTYNCNQTADKAPCTYEDAQRPVDFAIDQIVIHDIEGTARVSLDVFQNAKTEASVQYIIDSDGTTYQVVREKDIAYHAGNYWYNQHSIGIEHAGIDATGYRWYNASEYLASARLVAYLLKKYHLPLSHERIVSHGTIPSPSANNSPNHVDPGPYWAWDYYFKLIHEQGVPYPARATASSVFMLHPRSARYLLGSRGKESKANFAFFYLYNGPSTASGRIPQLGNGHDITDVSGSVEPDVSYYALARVVDPAGSGNILYKVWYGVVDHPTKDRRFAHARQAWLAVPRSAVVPGEGIPVALHADTGQGKPTIYGEPVSDKKYVLGDAPAGAVFVSGYTVTEDKHDTDTQNNNNNPGAPTTGNQNDPGDTADDPNNDFGDLSDQNMMGASGIVGVRKKAGKADGAGSLWYEVNYNHRQAWVPASEVTLLPAPGGR